MDDFFDIARRYRELKEDAFYPFDSIEDGPLIKKKDIDNKRNELDELRALLSEYKGKEIEQLKNNVIDASDILLKYIKKNRSGYPLDRNQGLVIEDYIFGKTAGVINSAFKNGLGVSYPEFYYRIDGDFDETDLRQIIIELKEELTNNKYPDYFSLEQTVDKYLEKIRGLWINESE